MKKVKVQYPNSDNLNEGILVESSEDLDNIKRITQINITTKIYFNLS